MATAEKFLQFRGEIRACLGRGAQLVLLTSNDTGQAASAAGSGVYRVDVEKLTQTFTPIEAGLGLATDGEALAVVSGDALYLGAWASGELDALSLGPKLGPCAFVSPGLLALGRGEELLLLDTGSKKVVQELSCEAPITALAADESGEWLVAGTNKGHLVVFDKESKDAFLQSSAGKAHEGAVTVLHFEPEELRIISGGADNKIMVAHVRGTLLPEEANARGRHGKPPVSILLSEEEELYFTTSADKLIKSWSVGKRTIPSSQKKGVGVGVALAWVRRNEQDLMVQASADKTLRFFELDEKGRPEKRVLIIRDAYAWADNELAQKEKGRREKALLALAGYDDQPALQRLSQRVDSDPDHKLRLLAVQKLSASASPLAAGLLEGFLRTVQQERRLGEPSAYDEIRLEAFAGLRKQRGMEALEPIKKALGTGQENLGAVAVDALSGLAKRDDQALAQLLETLDHGQASVRMAAFDALERFFGVDTPVAALKALGARTPDVRVEAILRLRKQDHLEKLEVRAAMRRALDDGRDEVRATALHVSYLRRPALSAFLRYKDSDLHRALYELEHGLEGDAKLPKAKRAAAKGLSEEDLEPLTEALAGHQLDICLSGAKGLALLGDPRALGALLQLSQDQEASARVQACQSLQILGDARALQRLRGMLRDGHAEVRDAAFSALAKLLDKARLDAANAGLSAEHEDVRKRGLQLLVRELRKLHKKGAVLTSKTPGVSLLERALNDSANAIRKEALKAALNLNVGGEEADAGLRFVLFSIHGDVRREVLKEVMGQINEDWAWPLLLDLFDDPELSIRREALGFAQKKGKKRVLDALRRALKGRYPDVRIEATKALTKRKEEGAQLLLVQAMEDEDNTVRQLAVDALAVAGVQSALVAAMQSKWDNVRLHAARARAEFGDKAAYAPLLAEALRERPVLSEPQEIWQQYVNLAVLGLSVLGDSAAVKELSPLLAYEEKLIRANTAYSILWCATPDHFDLLRDALQHEDFTVKYYAALALAFHGDETGASLIFNQMERGKRRRNDLRRRYNLVGPDTVFFGMQAALALKEAGEEQLLAMLGHKDRDLHERALLLVLLQEMAGRRDDPRRCIAAMSSLHPRIRLTAAWAVELWDDREAFDAFVTAQVNDRGAHVKPGTLSVDEVRDLAAIITHGEGSVRQRFVSLLWYLTSIDDELGTFTRIWSRLKVRFAKELEAARAAQPEVVGADVSALDDLVLGVYIGLVRSPVDTRARERAIHRMKDLGLSAKEAARKAIIASLFSALRDGYGAVRRAAFEALEALSVEPALLATEALGSGQREIGVLGMELLTARAEGEAALEVLRGVLLKHSDGLEYDATRLLAERTSWPGALALALGGHERLANWAVYQLHSHLEHKETPKVLKEALESRYAYVRQTAAEAALRLKMEEGYEVLNVFLASDDRSQQSNAINALKSSQETKVLDLFFARLQEDPAKTALTSELFEAIGGFRSEDTFARLLEAMEEKRWRRYAFDAALQVTGYDQYLRNSEDEDPSYAYEKKQHPRRDERLGALMERALDLGYLKPMNKMITGARWGLEAGSEGALLRLSRHPEDGLRERAVEALGWRARRRKGGLAPLEEALVFAHPVTQFLAAEGLALAGNDKGASVLLTALNTLDDLDYRRRAVKALGELAEPRALDPLLTFVKDEEHALHLVALEALGHMRESDRREEIFKLLEASTKEYYVPEEAIEGLRWFATAESWQLLRDMAKRDSWQTREYVATALRHDKDPASLELLKAMVRDDDSDVALAAVQSLRHQLGDDIEVDYSIVRSSHDDLEEETLSRLREKGDPSRLFVILAEMGSHSPFIKPISEILVGQSELPVAAAVDSLGHISHLVGRIGARIIGRAGEVNKTQAKALTKAVGEVREQWLKERAEKTLVDRQLSARWAQLLWALGRVNTGEKEVLAALTALSGDAQAKVILAEAIKALADGLGKAKGKKALAEATMLQDPSLRGLAATALRALDGKAAAKQAEGAVTDPAALKQLVSEAPKGAMAALQSASTSVHYQGAVLGHLVANKDIKGLVTALSDAATLPAARIGLVEALGSIADKKVDKPLLQIAKSEDEDTDLRKAAWRALRRSKRLRARA